MLPEAFRHRRRELRRRRSVGAKLLRVSWSSQTTTSFRRFRFSKNGVKTYLLLHKRIFMYFAFLAYLVTGAGILTLIESRWQPQLDFARPTNITECLQPHGYWGALCFVISAASTIGFGNIFPCTSLGRCVAVFYSFTGVPLVLYVLANLGRHLCIILTRAYPQIRNKFALSKRRVIRRAGQCSGLDHGRSGVRRGSRDVRGKVYEVNSNQPKSRGQDICVEGCAKDDQLTDQAEEPIPLTLGVCLTLCCVGVMAVHYHYYEHYNTDSSVYYAFMTFLGGDYVTTRFTLVIPVYITIFCGFSMLSLTISIFQSNVETFIKNLKLEILDNVSRNVTAGLFDSDNETVTQSVSQLVDDAVKNSSAPWWVKCMCSAKHFELLKQTISVAINKSETGSQTEQRSASSICKKNENRCSLSVQTSRNLCSNSEAQTVREFRRTVECQAHQLSMVSRAVSSLGPEKADIAVGSDSELVKGIGSNPPPHHGDFKTVEKYRDKAVGIDGLSDASANTTPNGREKCVQASLTLPYGTIAATKRDGRTSSLKP